MTTPQATLQQIVTAAITAAVEPLSLQQLYNAVAEHVTFDAADLRPPMLRGKPTAEPAWQRNVRNALYDAAERGRLVNISHDQWQLATPNPGRAIPVASAWESVRAAARLSLDQSEIFASTQQTRRYRVASVEDDRIIILRLDKVDGHPETLTRGEVERAITKLNAAGGRSGRRTLNYTVAKEVPLVHFHPRLAWSADGDFVETVAAEQVAVVGDKVIGVIDPEKQFPDEVSSAGQFLEGATKWVVVNVYERDKRARARCLEHYGVKCCVCELDFADRYGIIGAGFIHVHHLVQLSDIGREYKVDPIRDLRPVCPNCHAMLHRMKNAPITIDTLQTLMEKAARPKAE